MLVIQLFYLLTLFIAFVSCNLMHCPSEEEMKPCYCKRIAYGLHVICANFNSSFNLVKAFKILRDYNVSTVLLHRLYMTDVLPNDLFDDTHIDGLTVENSKLKFSQPAFTGLENTLYYLYVGKDSVIESKDDFTLARLNKLERFHMKLNRLGKVNDTWLNGKIPNVRTLVLENNNITEVESHAFSTLLQLERISMAGNQIMSVRRSMFPHPALHLESIDLNYNKIETLETDIFAYMPSLRFIFLAGNDLKTLPETTWVTVWKNLFSLILIENKIVCDKGLNWLKKFPRVNDLEGYCVAPKEVAGKSIAEVYYE